MPVLRCLMAAALLIGVLVPAPPAHAAAAESWTTTLRVQAEDYSIGPHAVSVAGYTQNDTPGAPALPVWSTVVELPVGGDYQINYQSIGAVTLEQTVAVAAAPVPDLSVIERSGLWDLDNAPTVAPTVDRPDPAIYGLDAYYPASLVSGEEQWQRGQRLLFVRAFPFQYNPVSGRLRYHPDVQITISLTPGAAQANTLQAAITSPANPPAHTPGALRIRTGAAGLYRLTYNDLLAAGVPLASADVATFAVWYLGQQVAVEITGNGNNLFEPGELVVFYAEPYQGRFQADNVYWFTYGGAPGLRMAARTTTPSGSEPVVTAISQTARVERQLSYESTFPLPADVDHWFDTRMSPDQAASQPTINRDYTFTLDDPLFTGTARLRAAFHGGAVRPGFDPDKSVAISVNGNLATTHQWQGMTPTTVEVDVPAAWLTASPRIVRLTASVNQIPGIGFYSIAPDWVTVTYPAVADAEGDKIYIEAVAGGANEVRVTGWTTATVQVYDLRDPAQPVRLLTTGAAQTGPTAYTLSFWDEDLPGPTYFLSTRAALSAPLSIQADAASNWGTPGHEADYIAIVHASLWSGIDPLLAQRAAEGMAIAKVDVQDIYDEWSYGRRDPEAIRSFLRYAYHCWNGADCDPLTPPPNPPQYVLLVGDGHHDFTGVSGTTLPNLIPPYLAHIDPWWGEVPADNRFVNVDGPGDYLPDMTLGRISATNSTDLAAAIAKIISYETTSPAGQWQERVIFVADNNLDPAGNFHALSNDIRFNWLPAGYDDRTIYYNLDYFSGSAMRQAIKDAYNDKAFMVQWFGHGNIVRWGSVEVFRIPDVPALNANDAWPFTVSYTCLNGYFNNITQNLQSMSETLVNTPLRGSVAAFAPSGLHIGPVLFQFNRGVVDAVFQQRIERGGKAADAARQFYFANSSSFREIIDAYTYFGDPATKLRLPTAPLENSTAEVSPSAALPGETLHYTVTVQNDGAYPLSDVVVTVDYDQSRGQVTASSPAATNASGVLIWNLPSVPPGATILTFDLQLDAAQPAGTTPIHAPTTVQAYGVPWAELDPTATVSALPDLGTSTFQVSRAWAPPGFGLTYTLDVVNSGNTPSTSTMVTVTLPADLVDVSSSSMTYDPLAHQLAWQGAVDAGETVPLTFDAAMSPSRTACGQVTANALVRDVAGQTTPLAAAVDAAVPDVDCNGVVNIVDIQLVTARWNTAAGDPSYHPRYDLNGDDTIDVADIVVVAGKWQ